MSKLLNRSYYHKKLIYSQLCAIQRRYNSNFYVDLNETESLDTSQALVCNLLDYAKENIISPQTKELSFRPRYKTLTMNEMNEIGNDLISSSTETFYTPQDFIYSKFLPVQSAQDFIDYLHDFMPYWSAIIIVPFLAKFAFTIPITIFQQRSSQKIQPLLPTAMKEYRKAANKYRGDKTKFNQMTAKIQEKYGFNPLYAQFRPLLAALAQAPVHLTFFVAFRTMYSSYPDWKYGGLSWFENLSISDPYWFLPLTVGATMAVSFLNSMRYMNSDQLMFGGGAIPPNMVKGGFVLMAVIMVPFAHFWSAGFNMYMSANILSYLLQTTLMQNDNFRSIFGLKPASWLTQYQKEVRDVNKTANESMRETVNEDNTYLEIKDKYQRKRLQTTVHRKKP